MDRPGCATPLCAQGVWCARQEMSVREARGLPLLLDKVQASDEVVVLRRRIEVGGLVRPEREAASLPDLSGPSSLGQIAGQGLEPRDRGSPPGAVGIDLRRYECAGCLLQP